LQLRQDRSYRKIIADQRIVVVVGSGVSVAGTNNTAAASGNGLLSRV
jgi:hypothetical protein